MAIMIPPMPFDFHGSYGEKDVFEALSKLPSDVYVLHSLRWVGRTQRSASQGEADFVILDPRKGILVLEVKSGNISYHDRLWYQENTATGVTKIMQDPEEQASRSKFLLLEALHGKIPHKEFCLVCHAVWFPKAPVDRSKMPLNLPPAIVLDAVDLENAESSLTAVFDFWSDRIRKSELTAGTLKRILEVIAPVLSIVPSPRFKIETRERQFLRLTNEQARILEYLEDQDKAVISGTAGTGKTVIALEKARRLGNSGRNVLLLCYNATLKTWLRKMNTANNVSVESFDSLATKYVKLQNNDYDKLKSDFIEKLGNEGLSWEFTDVVIDEGQDFQDDWIEWLRLVTPGAFYVFFDPNQTLFTSRHPAWVDKAECRLTLKRNCRNTFAINRTSHRFLDLTVDKRGDCVDGPKPVIWKCDTGEDAAKGVSRLVTKFLSEGIRKDEITILALQSIGHSIISKHKLDISPYLVNDPEDDAICFTTIKRFKGLESNIIIIVDFPGNGIDSYELQKLLYVGASRAKHELHIFLNPITATGIADLVGALAPGRKVPKNMNGVARLLDAQWNEITNMEVE
jgi:hypothetical protein